VAAPIAGPDGKAARVLAAHLSWEWTRSMKERALAPVESARKVQLMLVDTTGRVVMPPDPSVPIGRPFAALLGAASTDPSAAWADGRSYLRAEAPTFATGAFPGLGWRVVARQPMAVALAGAEGLRNYFLAGGLALGLLSAAIGWLLAGRIVRPVSDLARAASALTPGTNLAPATGREPRDVAQVRDAFQRVTGDALAKAERLMGELDTIYEGAPVGLCVLGPDLRCSRANSAWEEAFGMGAGSSVAPPPALLDAARKAFQMGTAWAIEIESGPPGGERVWQTVLAPVRGSDGRAAAVSVVATEVTEIRRAERALRLADQRKTEFIAMLAHELRNPLAPVVTALEVLKRNPAHAQAERMREMMQTHIRRMTRLIDDLLDVSRVNLGKVELKDEEVSLAEVCGAAVDSVRSMLEARKQELRLDVDRSLPKMRGDRVRLEQVVCNLLSNANRYGRDGGFVALSLQASGQHARVVVEDDGRGIDLEFLPDVFELFAQGDVPLDRADGGLGIGLALVKSLVELHGGEVAAFSEGPGKGSRFVVELPLARLVDAEHTSAQMPSAQIDPVGLS
jgi:signal transduction histidine kinase